MTASPNEFRRVAVLGDVHCENVALERALNYLQERESVDATLCVGDIVDGQGDADATLDLLRDRNVICVAGNHERWFLTGKMRNLDHITPTVSDENRAFLAELPVTRRFETAEGGALLCHAVGEDDMTFLRAETKGYALQIPALRALMLDSDVQYMLAGHTHERMVRVFQGLVVVNAGTLRRDDNPGFMVVDFGEKSVRYFDVPVNGDAIREAESLALPSVPPIPRAGDEDGDDDDDWW